MDPTTLNNDDLVKPRTRAATVFVRTTLWTYLACCFAMANESLYERLGFASALWPYAEAISRIRLVAGFVLPFALVGLLLFPIGLVFLAILEKLDRYDASAAVLILIVSGFAIFPMIQ